MAAREPTSDTRQALIDSAQRLMALRGYTSVGLAEVLAEAAVPKGSFYHWFASKDAFGEAMMRSYFVEYLADMDELFARPDRSAALRLCDYLASWREMQSFDDCSGKCLAVKLSAEVADLSEAMRGALVEGTASIVERLGRVLQEGADDGSLRLAASPGETGAVIFDLWLGASVVVKINRDLSPLDRALAATRQLVGI